MVVLEGTGPSAMALAALLRCATQELAPAWTITTLQIPDPGVLPPQAHDWPHLLEAASAHSDLRWEKGHLLAPVIQPWPSGRFRIASDGRGALEGLQPLAMKAAVLQPGQLELRVEATGLNFRDVLYALALLDPQEVGFACAEDLPLGGECVGRVVGVGPGVDPALVGTTMVAALAVGSLASHVVVAAERCVPLPPGLTSSEGAAVSTAFLTAMYGLEQLADLQAGDTVLIHAAAGGVGQAAIQIAQRRGARILATASEAKQAALLTQGVEAVFDSRSLAFSDQVLAHTEDRGVDVVLNSLKGPWVEASFRCLAQGGRFVELGKLEVWSSDDVHIRRPDVRYRCFDLLEVVEREPGLIRSMLEGLMHDLSSGQLRTPPLRSFPIEQCDEAFRWMAQARHVGKVVLTQAPPLTIRRDATYVVSGALGGIGPQLVDWLVEQGARSLLLVGREQRDLEERAEPLLQRLRQRGVRAGVVGCNLGCGDSAALQTALGQLPAAQSVRGLFHAAGVLRDRRLTDLSNADLAAVMAPKAQGLEQLEQACPGLEFVVGFSSIAALLGSPGQAAYAAANGAMEGLTGAEGPRRLTIQWGPWSGEGMAASHGSRFSAQGIGLLPPAAALEQLGQLMEQGADGVVAVTQNDWARLLAQAPPRQRPWFQALNSTAEAQDDGQRERLWQQLEGLPAAEQEQRLVSALAGVLERVMVAEQGSEADQLGPIDPTASLFELGVDSLMAAEFTALVQAELGLALDLRNLSDDPSLASLGARARLELFGSSTDGEAGLDLAAEAQLSCDWQLPDQPPARCPGSAILLTGASGYLGAYLLAGQLQRWPELTVQCLVRASSEQAGLERVRSNLEHYGLWQAAWEARLRVVPGDLAQPRFGLDADRFAALARGLGGILHNGAQLSQMAPYAQLAAANVEGTRTVLELACTAQPLRVELISSVAVLEAAAYRNQDVLETDPVDAWQGIHLGYSQTKWVSEQLVWNAGKAGLPVAVYRPPLIGGHSQTGQWHEGDLLQRLLQGALALGMAPDLAWALDTVPVDYVADAVTALAWDPATHGRCFHLQHPEPMLLAELVGLLQAEGAPLQLVPMHAWIRAIEAEPTNQLYPLLSFLQQRWGAEQLTYPELNSKGLRSRPSSEATSEALAKHGVQCPAFAQLVGPWAQALMGSRC
jgi:thioester reductase-like protein